MVMGAGGGRVMQFSDYTFYQIHPLTGKAVIRAFLCGAARKRLGNGLAPPCKGIARNPNAGEIRVSGMRM